MRNDSLLKGSVLTTFAALVSAAHAQYNVTVLNATAHNYDVGRVGGYTAAGTKYGPPDHAVIWNTTTGTETDIHPTTGNWTRSYASAVSGTSIVGYGRRTGFSQDRGILWTNNGATAIDMTPTGSVTSHLFSIDGNRQVGYTGPNSFTAYATVWTGTADSAVNLNPTGYSQSYALDVSGSHEVGYALKSNKPKAMLWNDTAASFIDLTPAGVTESYAYGVDGNSQVGVINMPSGDSHAYLWHGAATGGIDLNPAGALGSSASIVKGGNQYGYYYGADYLSKAAYWSGTGASMVDLNASLAGLMVNGSPVNIITSYTSGIDASGRILGSAYDDNGNGYAVEWAPVPEPSSMAALAVGACALFRRRRKLSR